ncbi:MAG TPA: hypothetical protein VFV94_06295 [Polyangiaceae bacterium]|nr:hypothetical protein [Polyangiaceae bacterium]
MRRFVIRAMGAVSLPLSVLFASAAAAQTTDAELSRRLSELERDTAHRSALAAPLEKAKRALERTRRGASGAGWAPQDPAAERQSALLRNVARVWLDVARDLVRTIDAEKAAIAAQKKLDEIETKVVRGKALLEETIARRARTQAQLDLIDRPKAELPPSVPPATAPAQAPVEKPPATAPKTPAKPEPRE